MTAVEFLAERYNYITWMRNRDEISAEKADEWRAEALEEAKGMGEQQLNKAWQEGAVKNKNIMKERTYRLEYNDSLKRFYLNSNRKCRQNTNGYITIFEDISDIEFDVFNEYLLSMRDKVEWSDGFVKDSATFIIRFVKNLSDRNIGFSKL